VREVAVADAVERRRRAVEPARDAPAEREMHARGAVVGAARLVLLRATAELRVGDDERAVPAADLAQRRLERDEPCARSPSRRACVGAWLAWVSKLPSDRCTTATPASLATTRAAVFTALPNGLVGNVVANA
jgi:hypothetical protein